MALSTPLLAVRGSEGIYMLNGPPKYTENASFTREDKKNCKGFIFSRDGSLFTWCNGENVNIVGTMDGRLLHSFDLPKVALLAFSPQNSILATWQPYITTKNNTQGDPNLHIWNLKSGQCLKSFFQKKMQGWCPCWSDDETICARNVNNEVQFFDGNAFDKIAHKLHLQKVSDFALSPGPQPCKVAVYVPGSKGAPSFVRLYQYPNFDGPSSALANKSFFKADKVTMLWNKKGTALLVIASTDVDKSGASYYGEQTLHYIASNGETALVQLPKNGPIYDVVWNPNSLEFCVVYGFMPAKVTVFNQKCDPVFDFGTGPRNAAFYSPQGHILVLAGFGNLRGQMEVWDVKKYKQISKPQAPDTTYFSWCPDGEHIVTATCAPRLRVSNGFKIWHYSGVVHHKIEVPSNSELWEVQWQPFVDGAFPEKAIKYQTVPNDVPSIDAKPAQAYRPPALRNKPVTSIKLHEEEPPQNMKPQTADKQLSKAALKNQKKREARKAAKQQESRPEVIQEAPPDPEPREVPSAESHGDPEIEKKIKNIKKKLKAIEQLKEQEASGKQLEKNQLEKMQKEEALLKELEDLELASQPLDVHRSCKEGLNMRNLTIYLH